MCTQASPTIYVTCFLGHAGPRCFRTLLGQRINGDGWVHSLSILALLQYLKRLTTLDRINQN
jgi:hypothetical protein